jgi:hypothetical protein
VAVVAGVVPVVLVLPALDVVVAVSARRRRRAAVAAAAAAADAQAAL